MSFYLCISATFIDPLFHGQRDRGEREWPPSPLRLLQAMVAASGEAIERSDTLREALEWLEERPAPIVLAPKAESAEGYLLSVPNNAMDLPAKSWSKGNYFGSGDSDPRTHRTFKAVRPTRLLDQTPLFYLYPLAAGRELRQSDHQLLQEVAARVFAFGWGYDFVAAQAEIIDEEVVAKLPGERWLPGEEPVGVPLRIPMQGTLCALRARHEAFLHRIEEGGTRLRAAPPLRQFAVAHYRKAGESDGRPYVVLELRTADGRYHVHPPRRLMHLAGMVRHLAAEAMTAAPPEDAPDDWVERFVLGHRAEGDDEHTQFSYVPMPSIGHAHADHAIRRIMIIAPHGCATWLDHLAQRLSGETLQPETGNEFDGGEPPLLHRVYRDPMARHYTRPSNTWASVTPVILPGHDDHKPAKTRRLIEKALAQAGIEARCTYEWGPFGCFPKSYSAHKYDKNGQPQGYLRPGHLLQQTALHLALRFDNDLQLRGPLTIGAGRHIGFGLMAPTDPEVW